VVPIDCPEINVKAFMNAVKKYGKYPISI